MDFSFPQRLLPQPLTALQKAGYFPFQDPKSGEHSFVLRLGPDFYPRFHLYLKEKNEQWIFSLHLDQKKPSYAGTHMHGGEYDGPLIEKEAERIHGWVQHIVQSQK